MISTQSGVIFTLLAFVVQTSVQAQAPDVPIMRDRGDPAASRLMQAANAAREQGSLLSQELVAEQMHRRHFPTPLSEPHSIPLHSRAIWERSRAAHVRVGFHYLCHRCDNWHQNFAGGFFINAYGLVATCQHVIDPGARSYREGYLIAAGDDGTFYPVLEVLASDGPTDVAILRVAVDKPVPYLPLNMNVFPGDGAWLYSYPLRRAGYFSQGIVNRFHYEEREGVEVARMAVTTDWAPGSSGSAIVDVYGNAVGMVSTITPLGTGRPQTRVHRQPGDDNAQDFISDPTAIIFRTAARAADVIALTQPGTQPHRTLVPVDADPKPNDAPDLELEQPEEKDPEPEEEKESEEEVESGSNNHAA